MKISLFILVFCATALSGYAQQKYSLYIIPAGMDSVVFRKKFSCPDSAPDSVSAKRAIQSLLNQCYAEGYLLATYHNIKTDSAGMKILFIPGGIFQWAKLRKGNVPSVWLAKSGFHEEVFDNKYFFYKDVLKIFDNLLSYAENNGYPFAAIRLDSVQINNDRLSAALHFNKGVLTRLDTIIVKGSLHVSDSYLYSYLGIRPVDLYNENLIRQIDAKLRQLNFASETKSARVFFHNGSATLLLFLDKKQASQFDAVIGVLPNNEVTGKLILTGQGNISLTNMLQHGEQFALNFTKIQTGNTSLHAALTYPFLFSLPLGVNLQIDLAKFDTTYLNVNQQIGFQFYFSSNQYVKAFFNRASTTILSVDTNTIISTHQLPSLADIVNPQYGLNFHWQNEDYLYNPHSGWLIDLSGSAGVRQVKENNQIIHLHDPFDTGFNFANLYDTVKLHTLNYSFTGLLQKYFSLAPRWVVKTGYQGGMLVAPNLYINQLYRIGGYTLLRGFDEQSVFASAYHIGTLELRYLIGLNSNVYIFSDGGFVRNSIQQTSLYPLAIGAGITFDTKAGLFGISYALGKTQSTSFDLRSAKIHFGYLAYF